MLIVETYLKETRDKGIGLFAKNKIPAGTVYWERNTAFDKIIPISEYQTYGELQKDFILKYGSLELNGEFYICMDNSRFVNHSDTPNTTNIFDKYGLLVICKAKWDIQKDEEIVCDYRECCQLSNNQLGFNVY